ncbi:TPA: type IV secretion system protein [Campylobacter fetus subsp. venerealis]|uniref:type IV secretion system protein n=1 Tax=Campylobacter fetus TaxID=196 RepID=UPI0003D82710|nr:type IV secretion system protein [Campylobacter fetus]OCS31306.1 hypothetical protein CFVLMG6570_06325 [Campylobacter fetus subsp. venerealis LMG 6570 = CCUG 33900]OCS41631.1 hypothetical protein CFVI02298_06600 [Campylobacter fetus subsp. venerealis cfvi02/298]AHE94576.1 type IV secretion system protein VirB6 [Campylobacter fetus subsp. venerealis cfvi03/293]AIR80991.1 type IV secretion system protein VirB6 [Campylobacter fetus subsp. venerealis 97/608]KAA3683803.1 type IV secretion system
MYAVKTEVGKGLYSIIMDISSNVDNFFSKNYSTGVNTLQSVIDATGNILAIYLTVWIMIEGYKILWGNAKQSFQNFAFDATIKFIFIVLSMNAGNWINLVFEAFNGAKDFIDTSLSYDSKGVYEKVAIWAGLMGDYYRVVWDKSGTFEIAYMIFIIIVAFIGFLIGAVPILRALFVNTLSFLLLMILAPLAFYFLIFKTTKNSFSQWFQMVLSNIVTLLCLSLFLNILFDYIFIKLNKLNNFYDEAFLVALLMIFYGILANVICGMAVGIAEKLTNISLDGLAGSGVGRAMGLTGAIGGAAIGGAMLGARAAQVMGAGKAAGFIGSRLMGSAASAAKEIGSSKLGQSVGQKLNEGLNTLKGSSTGKAVGARLDQAKNIGAKINNFTKGQGW